MTNDPIPFTINLTGEITKEFYKGTFKAKSRLTHREQMRKDQMRRQLIGGDPQFADQKTIYQAEIFSQLSVRLTDTPSWWKDSDGGLDLADDNVIAEIYKQVMRFEQEALEALKKDAETAKVELGEIKEQK